VRGDRDSVTGEGGAVSEALVWISIRRVAHSCKQSTLPANLTLTLPLSDKYEV